MPTHEVELWEGKVEPGYILYDLPLNGEWSDLTATFDLLRRDGSVVLQLSDIHVM